MPQTVINSFKLLRSTMRIEAGCPCRLQRSSSALTKLFRLYDYIAQLSYLLMLQLQVFHVVEFSRFHVAQFIRYNLITVQKLNHFSIL